MTGMDDDTAEAREAVLALEFESARERLLDRPASARSEILRGVMAHSLGELGEAKGHLRTAQRLAQASFDRIEVDQYELAEYLLLQCELQFDWTISSPNVKTRIERFISCDGLHAQRLQLQLPIFLQYAIGCGDLYVALAITDIALQEWADSSGSAILHDLRSIALDLLGFSTERDSAFLLACTLAEHIKAPLSRAMEIARLFGLAERYQRCDAKAALRRVWEEIPGPSSIKSRLWAKSSVSSKSLMGTLVG